MAGFTQLHHSQSSAMLEQILQCNSDVIQVLGEIIKQESLGTMGPMRHNYKTYTEIYFSLN